MTNYTDPDGEPYNFYETGDTPTPAPPRERIPGEGREDVTPIGRPVPVAPRPQLPWPTAFMLSMILLSVPVAAYSGGQFLARPHAAPTPAAASDSSISSVQCPEGEQLVTQNGQQGCGVPLSALPSSGAVTSTPKSSAPEQPVESPATPVCPDGSVYIRAVGSTSGGSGSLEVLLRNDTSAVVEVSGVMVTGTIGEAEWDEFSQEYPEHPLFEYVETDAVLAPGQSETFAHAVDTHYYDSLNSIITEDITPSWVGWKDTPSLSCPEPFPDVHYQSHARSWGD